MSRWAALALALVLGGCGPAYGSVDIYVIGGHRQAEASTRRFHLVEGGVIVIRAEPIAADGHNPYNGLERFELRVADSRIARARRGVLKDTWIINASSPGTTHVQVRVDGDVMERIPLRVEPQVVP